MEQGKPVKVAAIVGPTAVGKTAVSLMLAERLGFDDRIIEAQLAHTVTDSLGRAYNRTEFVAQRRAMMQAWADYLDKLKAVAEVVKLRA